MADLRTKDCVDAGPDAGTHDVTVKEFVVAAVVHTVIVVVVVAGVCRFKKLQAGEILCKRSLRT
jgi:hypothetical protein